METESVLSDQTNVQQQLGLGDDAVENDVTFDHDPLRAKELILQAKRLESFRGGGRGSEPSATRILALYREAALLLPSNPKLQAKIERLRREQSRSVPRPASAAASAAAPTAAPAATISLSSAPFLAKSLIVRAKAVEKSNPSDSLALFERAHALLPNNAKLRDRVERVKAAVAAEQGTGGRGVNTEASTSASGGNGSSSASSGGGGGDGGDVNMQGNAPTAYALILPLLGGEAEGKEAESEPEVAPFLDVAGLDLDSSAISRCIFAHVLPSLGLGLELPAKKDESGTVGSNASSSSTSGSGSGSGLSCVVDLMESFVLAEEVLTDTEQRPRRGRNGKAGAASAAASDAADTAAAAAAADGAASSTAAKVARSRFPVTPRTTTDALQSVASASSSFSSSASCSSSSSSSTTAQAKPQLQSSLRSSLRRRSQAPASAVAQRRRPTRRVSFCTFNLGTTVQSPAVTDARAQARLAESAAVVGIKAEEMPSGVLESERLLQCLVHSRECVKRVRAAVAVATTASSSSSPSSSWSAVTSSTTGGVLDALSRAVRATEAVATGARNGTHDARFAMAASFYASLLQEVVEIARGRREGEFHTPSLFLSPLHSVT